MPDSLIEGNTTGRPAIHSQELESAVLASLSVRSMVKTCEMEGMPSRETIYRWIDGVEGFSDKYARAVRERSDHRAEMIDEIGEKVLRGEVEPNAGKVVIDALKWTASKLQPKKYGERLDLGNADGKAFQVTIAK